MGLPQHTFGLRSVRRKIDKIHSRAGELVSRSAAAIENNGTLHAHERRAGVWGGRERYIETRKCYSVQKEMKRRADGGKKLLFRFFSSNCFQNCHYFVGGYVCVCVCVCARVFFPFISTTLIWAIHWKKNWARTLTRTSTNLRWAEKCRLFSLCSVAVCLGRWMRTLGGIASSKQSHLFMRNCLQAEVDENGNWRENEQQQQQQNDYSWWWTMELSIRHAIEHYRTVIRGANWIGGFNMAHPAVCRSA